jgi:hypothetical protein
VVGGLITAGTWNYTNGAGLEVDFTLLGGTNFQSTPNAWQTGDFIATANQVNCLDTVDNIFAITGVQLEVGAVATPFEHRNYGAELQLCQRYYERLGADGLRTFFGTGGCTTTTKADVVVNFRTTKRGPPAISLPTAASSFTISTAGTAAGSDANSAVATGVTKESCLLSVNTTGLTAGQYAMLSVRNDTDASYFVGVSAEL